LNGHNAAAGRLISGIRGENIRPFIRPFIRQKFFLPIFVFEEDATARFHEKEKE